jgi:hypothetical protein
MLPQKVIDLPLPFLRGRFRLFLRGFRGGALRRMAVIQDHVSDPIQFFGVAKREM